MKKVIFYSLLVFQIIFICLFVIQYQLIDKYGKEFTIEIDSSDYKEEKYLPNYAQLDLNIEKIAKEKWHIQKPTYQQKIYIVLKQSENNRYDVDRAVKNKPSADKDEIILQAKYLYTYVGEYVVDYGEAFKLKVKDFKINLNPQEPMYVTYKIAPWNQVKLMNLTN